MAEKLKPCPFCGKQVARLAGLNIGTGGYKHIWCDTEKGGCGASGGTAHFDSKGMNIGGMSATMAAESAVGLWNDRS